MEEEEIDEDEADIAAYVEELEEEATFDEMEEERDGVCGHGITRGLGWKDALRTGRGASSTL